MTADVGITGRLRWYVRRLRSMQPREVIWRLRQAALPPVVKVPFHFTDRQWADSLESFRTAQRQPGILTPPHAAALSEVAPDLIPPLLAAADQLADNTFQYFGYPPVKLSRPIDWNYDPISSTSWPIISSKRIDHRVAGGDVKWIWELNRLQHLPLLAQAWLFTNNQRYSRAAFEHLDSWMDQNPPGRGIAWRGAFEAGLRSISIALALQGLRDSPDLTVRRYQRVAEVLAVSAEKCWRERSLYSSANNHLTGEMAGLAVVALILPDLPGAERWLQRAVRTLTVEATKWILPDGCGAEQSIAYQIATVELLQLVAALLTQRDGRAPQPITEAISRSSRFLASIVGESDPDPRYGDADQELAVRLGPEEVRTVRQHLGITSALGWGAGDAQSHERTLAAEWYRQVGFRVAVADLDTGRGGDTAPRSFFAAHGGMVVLRRGPRRITMDVGPLGYLSIAAHGHADALAVTLSEGGQDVIGDPGTGSYYRHPQWRAVMRGTRAHPTVCVDNVDQSVIGGPFLWSDHATTRVRGLDLKAGVVDAEHDGYQRLPDRVMHRRWLIAPPDERALLVVDLITGRGKHEVRTTWPLHPGLTAARGGARHIVSRDGAPILEVHHASTERVDLEETYGDEETDLGWWSDGLESRTPSWWLSAVCCHTQLPVVIATLLCPVDGVITDALSVSMDRDTITVTWNENLAQRGKTIRIDAAADARQGPTEFPR